MDPIEEPIEEPIEATSATPETGADAVSPAGPASAEPAGQESAGDGADASSTGQDAARPRRGPAGKGSRQGRTPGKPRQFRHVVKVHPHVEEQLLLLAAPRGITISRLLVESALAGGADAARMRSELGAELFRVGQFLGKVGVNVNQIARATNATLETQPETVAAMVAVQRVCARLDVLLDQVEVPK